MGALRETVIALTGRFESVPRVRLLERLKIAKVADRFWHISACYGFIEVPGLPVALHEAKNLLRASPMSEFCLTGDCEPACGRTGRLRLRAAPGDKCGVRGPDLQRRTNSCG
jgi:hypothetical protein